MKTAGRAATRPLRADAARNRERILVAASVVFAQRGLEATMDDVAQHAGVGVGTVYRRFPHKEELIDALFEQAVEQVVDTAEEALAMPDPWEGLVRFLGRTIERQADDRGLRDVVLHGGYGRERVARARERIVPVVSRLVERAQRAGQLRPDVVATDVPMIELMVGTVSSYTSSIAPDLWRRYLAIMLDGLTAQRCDRSVLAPAPTREAIEAALAAHKLVERGR
jgi:AcrR family transcriptional regulator